MSIGKIVAFILGRKNILYSIISCFVGLVLLIIGMIICDKSFWNYLFVWIIPGSGIVILGTYSASMLDAHPVILFCPPTIYFLSLFIRFLVTHEYFIFFLILFEAIPFIIFCLHTRTGLLREYTRLALLSGILLLGCISSALIIALLLDDFGLIALPFYRTQTYLLLLMTELPLICQNISLLYLNNDLPVRKREPIVHRNVMQK